MKVPMVESGYEFPKTKKIVRQGKRQIPGGNFKFWREKCAIVFLGLTLWGISPEPGSTAERLTLKVGSFEQSVVINDLEQFADTGEISPSLQLYRPLLTPQLRQLLNKRLYLDPQVAESFLEELLNSPDGERLIAQLGKALPQSQIEELQAAVYLAFRQAEGLSILSFLRAYPQEHVTIDATAAVGIALQLNTSNLQSQLLEPLLERHLTIEDNEIFPLNFDPSESGEQPVRQRTLILRDRQRKRTIPVDLYYTRKPQGPLVVLSHGFAADRTFLKYLAIHLTSYGFTVAALEHPGSSVNAFTEISGNFAPTTLLSASEFVDRPQDIRFLLDELEKQNHIYHGLEERYNTKQVIVIGHSLGGYTALALAGGELNLEKLRSFCHDLSPLGRSPADWLQCSAADLPQRTLKLRDSRVVGAIALNPIIGNLFGDQGLEAVTIPTLMVSGTQDSITPILHHQFQPFHQLGGRKYFVAVVGGTHMSVTDMRNLNSSMGQSTLVKEVWGAEAEPIRRLVRSVSLAFIQQLTPQGNSYQSILTPHYVQSLSTQRIPLRLMQEVPPNLEAWLQVMTREQKQMIASALRERRISLSKPKKPFSHKIKRYLAKAKKSFPQITQCQGKLNPIFTSLWLNYRQDSDSELT